MSESNQFDNWNNNNGGEEESTGSDPYTVESSEELYRTPNLEPAGELTRDRAADEVTEAVIVQAQEEVPAETVVCEVVDADTPEEGAREVYDREPVDYAGNAAESMYGKNGRQAQDAGTVQNDNPYQGYQAGGAQTAGNGDPYGNSSYNGQNIQNNNLYGNNLYNGQNMQNNNPYGNNPYGIAPYIGQSAQNHSPYGSNPYNGQSTQYSNPYGNGGFYNGPNTQNNYQNPYGNPPGGNGYNGNNPYSPFAAPPKKNNNGLIIGVVIGIIVLFLVAVFALAYKLVDLYTTDKDKKRDTREEYDYDDYDDDEWDGNHNGGDYDDFFHDDYFDDDYDYPFGDDFPYDYDYDYDYDDFFGDGNDNGGNVDDDRYYSLHNEIRNDLQYSVKLEDYRYDTTYENVDIQVEYPVIEGENVPNLDKLNGAIKDEVDFIAEYFEEEYQDYMLDDDDYFMATSTGYVTYMDEEKMSIAFSEYIYSDYYNDVFVYCINIDMENGIILDNESLLNTDDAFSVEFRKRSDNQNGEISYLTAMTDQEITRHFKSSDIIVFYIPQGMEIGFNYDAGWVTVTYEDYEKYLKVF